tara:strand:+ start:1668 stop:2576 length:909 start_codon:yes stop_codon:yes gene_type:complete
MDNIFKNISNLTYSEQADLSKYSTMRLACTAPLAIASSIEAVQEFVKACQASGRKYKVLGWGANQLLVDHPDFVYLHLKLPFDAKIFEEVRNDYLLPASVSLAKLTSHAAKFGVKGWEVFTGIPASVGGAVFMNAGTNLGEIASVIEKVGLVAIDGTIREEIISNESFAYRHNKFCRPGEVIIWAKLKHFGVDLKVSQQIKDYLKLRNDSQPLNRATCGCMYKNYENDGMTCRAGLSLDIMGLKGLSFGGVRVSQKHANFMENTDNATREDVLTLAEMISSELKLSLGLEFELEVDTGDRPF